MTDTLAFVGDVHGNLRALEGILHAVKKHAHRHIVFLGDYINKGSDSAEVLELLLFLQDSGSVTLLKGNHEEALLDAIDTADARGFLKMGGAATIRSYVKGPVGPQILPDLIKAIPHRHLAGLREMPAEFVGTDIIAGHRPGGFEGGDGGRFMVSAHVPTGVFPYIDAHQAHIDTGCGSDSGRLTAFLWPERTVLQVDTRGERL